MGKKFREKYWEISISQKRLELEQKGPQFRPPSLLPFPIQGRLETYIQRRSETYIQGRSETYKQRHLVMIF